MCLEWFPTTQVEPLDDKTGRDIERCLQPFSPDESELSVADDGGSVRGVIRKSGAGLDSIIGLRGGKFIIFSWAGPGSEKGRPILQCALVRLFREDSDQQSDGGPKGWSSKLYEVPRIEIGFDDFAPDSKDSSENPALLAAKDIFSEEGKEEIMFQVFSLLAYFPQCDFAAQSCA